MEIPHSDQQNDGLEQQEQVTETSTAPAVDLRAQRREEKKRLAEVTQQNLLKALEEGESLDDKDRLLTIQEQVRTLRNQFCTLLGTRASLASKYDDIFARAATFIEPKKQVTGRSWYRSPGSKLHKDVPSTRGKFAE